MTDVRLTATNPEDSSVVPVACNAKGELKLEEPLAFDGNLNGDLTVTGSGSFDGAVTIGGGDPDSAVINDAIRFDNNGASQYRKDSTAEVFQVYSGGTLTQHKRIALSSDGSASLGGGKAGITAEGHFWCTTRRGDTVILDATSNGLATWADYTPPTRREIIEQKVNDIKDAAIKPSQQLPEE